MRAIRLPRDHGAGRRQAADHRAGHRATSLATLTCALVVVGAAVGLAACDEPGPDGTPAAEKAGDGVERHDLEPLVERVPALEGAADATWFSGTLGSRDAPGPTLYWIDAVVTLPPGAGAELRDTLDLAPVTGAPDVVDALVPALPDGELLAGPELDEAFSAGAWDAAAYLSASGDELVLTLVGE